MSDCCHHSDQKSADESKKTTAPSKNSDSAKSRLPVVIWGSVAAIVIAGFYLFDIQVTPSGRFQSLLGKEQVAALPAEELTAATLASAVVPDKGYTVDIVWGDTGKKLVEAGGIDLEKYRQNYGDAQYNELLSYLTDSKNQGITINKQNAYFWVNTLWALGLTQRSDVLDAGVMGTDHREKLGNFASTGGWTLGAKPAVDLYSSTDLVPLTARQQQLVKRISENVYRPCCGNSTAFPDCNHGMAALGLIELMVSQGSSEKEVYQAVLAFNSYWFSQTYTDLAYYFQTKENTAWADVDPKRVLAADFSSAQGYRAIKQQIGTVPGSQSGGSSCSA